MASLAFPDLARSVTLSDGTTYGYVYNKRSSPERPWLLFLHGFPSSCYDWRHEIKRFRELGYGLVVPDLLGYGDTDKPKDLESYAMPRIGQQVAELLEREGIGQVVGIGHDWGCGLLSSMARNYANNFSALVFMSVGYLGQSFGNIDTLNEETEKQLGYPMFGYWKFHEQDDCAEVCEAHARTWYSVCFTADPENWKTVLCPIGEFRKFVEKGEPFAPPPWLTDDEMAMHEQIVAARGLQGPLNWYKQEMKGLTRDAEAHLSQEERTLKTPTLFIGTLRDPVCLAKMNEDGTRAWTKDLTVANVDTGHWLMLEKPDEVDGILREFVDEKTAPSLLPKIGQALGKSDGATWDKVTASR